MAKPREASRSHIDALWGARAIADEIDRTERQTRHLIENGDIADCIERLPSGRIIGFRSKLRKRFGRLASDPAPDTAA
jgi:hypothetical protein